MHRMFCRRRWREEQAALEYNTAERNYIQEFQALAALVGRADLPLAPLNGNLEQAPQVDTTQITETILRESPSIKRARQDLAAAQAALRAAKRESIPDLTVRAGVGTELRTFTRGLSPRSRLTGFCERRHHTSDLQPQSG